MSIVHVPFYPSDWLAGTRGLSAEETGVYITLIARIYEMAGPIERDDKRLFRLCGCKSKTAFVKALEYLISEGKIIEVEGHLTNERAQKEIQNTTEKSAKAREKAQQRWDKKHRKNNGGKMQGHPRSICWKDANHNHSHNQLDSHPEADNDSEVVSISGGRP